jgi:serine/threonine-protein kinase
VGRYTIERELGAGGMATVYLAHDVRHDRPVAIKVLHPDLAAAMGSERFLAEIKTTARLQHPHTLALLDSGVAGGLLFYVMPLVTGESLRQRLTRERQVSVEDAVRIATEVADALDDAHRHGIIHRDIKPENILLQGGHAVVADFGIALAVQHASGQRLTQTGLSLGTPAYMSPEQAMGDRAIDARADIYALGAVTYEMLVGEPPFTGPTLQAIVAKVITEKPAPISAVRDTVPAYVEHAVLKALAKLPADRFASAAEFARALTTPTVTLPSVAPPRVTPRARWTRTAFGVVGGTALLVGGWLLRGAMRGADESSASGPIYVDVAMPSFNLTWDRGFAISPDGRTIAYTGSANGAQDLRLNRLTDGARLTVPGSVGAREPFFSPDGTWVGYQTLRGGAIYRASVDGTRPVEPFASARVTENARATWVAMDTVLVASARAIYRIVAGAASPDTLYTFTTQGEYTPDQMLRVGDLLLISTARPTCETLAFDLRRKTLSVFVSGYWRATPVASTRLLLANASGDLFVGTLNGAKTGLAGAPAAVLRGLQGGAAPSIVFGATQTFALASNGTLLLIEATDASRDVFVDRTGRVMARISASLRAPRFSPDGNLIVGMGSSISVHRSGPGVVAIYDIKRDLTLQLTTGASPAYPIFTPDGRRVMYSATEDSTPSEQDIYWQDAAGGKQEILIGGPPAQRDIVLTRDGLLGAYRVRKEGEPSDIWLFDRRTTPPSTRALIASANDELMPALSPDGAWLAYASDEGGAREVYVTDFPAAARRQKVSRDGGGEPLWSPKSSELYYRRGADFMAVAFRVTGGELRLEAPQLLFQSEYVESALGRMYDVSPDGTRFVFEEAPPTSHMRMIINWFGTWPREIRP